MEMIVAGKYTIAKVKKLFVSESTGPRFCEKIFCFFESTTPPPTPPKDHHTPHAPRYKKMKTFS